MIRNEIVRLKVKIKSLEAEAKIIKKEEQKALSWPGFKGDNGMNWQYQMLYRHRLDVVRVESRASLIAYGFLRGREYSQIEQNPHQSPHWEKVRKMVSSHVGNNAEKMAMFEEWKNGKVAVAASA